MMLRRTHGSGEQQPLFGHAQPALASEIIIFDTFKGTPGDDFIKGTEGDDTIDGLAGNDMLKGLGGDDVIHGGDGDDQIFGGDGDDTLYGDSGINELRGGNGDDHIVSVKKYDTIYGGIGENTLDTNAGSIVYSIFGGIDHLKAAWIWYVDYSLITSSIYIDNNGLRFSNGTTAEKIKTLNYNLGSGNDSVSLTSINGGAFINAGDGVDTISLIADRDNYLRYMLTSLNGVLALSAYDLGNNDGYFTSFENLSVSSPGYHAVMIDGVAFYQGAVINFDMRGIYTIDFSSYDGVVTALVDGDTMTINGSMIRAPRSTFIITLNDEDGHVTASGTLTGGAGDDTLTGLSAADTIDGGAGNDTIDGGASGDWLLGGAGDNIIDGGSGNDGIVSEGGLDTIDGGDGDDRIDAGAGDDVIRGGAGSDMIVAGAGRNEVDGGDGNDTITGGDDDDTLNGSAGADQIDGGLGHNIINGGDGDDVLVSASGVVDAVDGGAGKDSWRGDDTAATQDLVLTFDGSLHVSNGIEVANIESVSYGLGTGDDYLAISATPGGLLNFYGNAGVDTIDYSAIRGGGITVDLAATGSQDTGAGGIEAIYAFENVIGSAKNDTLAGTAGVNLMTGGAGADILTGGAGADRFIVTSLADLGRKSDIDKIDRVTDFSHTEGEKIDLRAIDADKKTDGDQAFVFVGTDAFTVGGAGPGEIRYSQSVDGYLLVQGDINHDGKADFSFLVHNTALVASDFVL